MFTVTSGLILLLVLMLLLFVLWTVQEDETKSCRQLMDSDLQAVERNFSGHL